MPVCPAPSLLPRFEITPRSGPWKYVQQLKSPKSRRMVFGRILRDQETDEHTRLRSMRTLIDLGLWGDHTGPDAQIRLRQDQRDLAWDYLRSCREGFFYPEFLHLTLEAGMDPHWRENNNHDDTLLTLFARHSQLDCIPLALQAGCDPNLRDTCADTPLHLLLKGLCFLSRSGLDMHSERQAEFVSAIELLLQSGVDINSPGKGVHGEKGSPPISIAIDAGNAPLLKWMINKGARVDVQDGYTETPFHWMSCTHFDWASDQADLVQLLVQHGAPIDPPNCRGETPIWKAMQWGNPKAVLWLMDHGAKVDVVPHTYQDPQGYEFPDQKGASLLALLCTKMPLNDETVEILARITQKLPNVWDTPVPDGTSLRQFLQATQSPWSAFVQADILDKTVSIAPVSASKRMRL